MPVLSTTATSFSGGATASTGVGENTLLTITGAFATGDTISLVLVDQLSALTTIVGQGFITGIVPTFAFTYKQKMNVLAGSIWYFSDLEQPIVFNNLNGFGNSFIDITDYFATPESLQALATYQGRMAIFSKTTTHIFQIDANPDAYDDVQTLQNIGTIAPFTVRSLGDMDVFFLSDTGIRSLRVRDASSNAYVADIGSPIDRLVQASLSGQTDAQKAAFYGIVEPVNNRYWCFVNDTIYVLSYFPTSKISAWSTYLPQTLNNVSGLIENFTPSKFEVHQGRVYVLDTNRNVYLYGGSSNASYDASVCTLQTPYLDAQKAATNKNGAAMKISLNGSWQVSASMNYATGTYTVLDTVSASNYDTKRIGYKGIGTHFSLKAVSTGSTAAIISSLVFQYTEGGEAP